MTAVLVSLGQTGVYCSVASAPHAGSKEEQAVGQRPTKQELESQGPSEEPHRYFHDKYVKGSKKDTT